MPGSSGNPSFTMLVNGSPVDMVANRVQLQSLTAYAANRSPTLTWTVMGGELGSLPDLFLSKSIELRADEGSGAYAIFKGTCEDIAPLAFSESGWVRSFTAHGLRDHADRMVPVTSPLDGTDAVTFNRRANDLDFDPALSGMTVGEMIRYVLDAPDIATGLSAVGVGGYSLAGGFGAAATSAVAGGVVTVTVQVGGSGYSSASPPTAVLVGGGGTYTSCSVAVDGQGLVTGVTVVGSTGYTSAPVVIISTLPAATILDLVKPGMTLIPPYPVTIQGDAALQAIEGCLRQNCRNHYLHVGTDGIIRIYDLRDAEASPVDLVLNSATPTDSVVDVARVSLSRSTAGCYGRVVVRGAPDVVPVRLSLKAGTLEKYYAHDGLTIAQAEAQWKLSDWVDPNNNNASTAGAATFTATVSGGVVTVLTITYKGFGYKPSTYYNLTFTGVGANAQARFLTDANGSATSYEIQNGGTGYTSAPTVTAPVTGAGNADTGIITTCTTTSVTVQSNDSKRTWPADSWSWGTGGRHGVVYLTASSDASVNQLYGARVVSNTELVAGGTSTLTLDRVLPITTYNTYYIVGAAGTTSEVYRRYRPVNAGLRKVLMARFPYPQAMASATGTGLYLTTQPTAWIVKEGMSGGSATMGLTVDVSGGSFLLDQPSVMYYESRSKLLVGGSTITLPDDIQVFAAVRHGNLQAISPANSNGNPQYTGTGHAIEGFSRTLVVTTPDWVDKGNQANMDAYASDLLDSVKDVVVEGVVPLLGYYHDWVTLPNQGCRLSASYATYWDNIPLPVVECVLTFRGTAGLHRVELHVSNRRGATNAAIFERPIPTGGFLSDVSGVFHGFAPVYGEGPVFTSPADLALDVVAGAYGQAQGVAAQMHATTPTPDQWLSAWSPAGAGTEFAAPPGPAPPQGESGTGRLPQASADYQPWRDLLQRLGIRRPPEET